MSKYIAGIDGGTMGVRCIIVDFKGNQVSSAYFETAHRISEARMDRTKG